MSLEQIKSKCSEMKLKGILSMLELTLEQATSHEWSYTDLLNRLLQVEKDDREQRKVQSRIKSAKLRKTSRFEQIDLQANRSITKAQVKELYELNWIKQSRPMVLIGPTGIGKTYLVEAIGLHACENGYTTLFKSMSELFENIMMARTSGNYLRMRDRMVKPDLLILDDFGLRKINTSEAHDLCEILEMRSINKSTIITTQLPFEHWKEVIEDEVIADAIIDRMLHTSYKLTITGQSYRAKKGESLDKNNRK